MGIISSMRRQRCVVWLFDNFDDFGKPCLKEPLEVACRWDSMPQQFINPDGTQWRSTATVYPEIEVPQGSVMWLGQLKDLEKVYADGSKRNPEAAEVRQFITHPNLKNTEKLYICNLGSSLQ